MLDALVALTDQPRGELARCLHARALGSYVRGQSTCGDIDMCAAPSPGAMMAGTNALVSPGSLLIWTVTALLDAGHLTPDKPFNAAEFEGRAATEEAAWLGVWKGPSSPCRRKIDFKFYAHERLAVAVADFSSGKAFAMALHWWAKHPPDTERKRLKEALSVAGGGK